MYQDEEKDLKKFGRPDYIHICHVCHSQILTFGAWIDKDKRPYHPQCLTGSNHIHQ